MRLPSPRGTLTTALFPALRGIGPFPVDELVTLVCDADSGGATLDDDDVHTALWAAYQLHYTGFDDVDDRWEWDPDLLRLRRPWRTGSWPSCGSGPPTSSRRRWRPRDPLRTACSR